MSTTMVSSHVQALEDRLGARLLNRTTRKVSLTEIGKAYYERATRILSELEEADQIAGALQSSVRGTLRLHASAHVMRLIGPVVAEYLATYPDVSVELGMGERMVDLIEEGVDLAIRTTLPPELEPDHPPARVVAVCSVLCAGLSRGARGAARAGTACRA